LQQSGYAQQNGSLNSGTFGFAWHDVIVSRRGSTVDWAVDGVRFATISNATFTASNVFVGFWDSFASLSSNNVINFGLVDNVRVEVPAIAPTISLQPVDLSVKLTSNATFTVAASGLPAPSFQWLFNGTNIPGAAASSYARTNVQVWDRGNYSVMVSNVAGSIMSSNAALALIPPRPAQFQSVSLQPDYSLRIVFNGDPEWSYTVEASTNLINWSSVTNLTSASGVFDFIGDSTKNETQRFYRARSGP
jgi:Immunoglobulin domain